MQPTGKCFKTASSLLEQLTVDAFAKMSCGRPQCKRTFRGNVFPAVDAAAVAVAIEAT